MTDPSVLYPLVLWRSVEKAYVAVGTSPGGKGEAGRVRAGDEYRAAWGRLRISADSDADGVPNRRSVGAAPVAYPFADRRVF